MTPRAAGWAVAGAFAGLFAGLLLAIPLAGTVRDQPSLILASTLIGAPLGWIAGRASSRTWDVAGGVSGGGVEGTPPTAVTADAPRGGEAGKPSETPPATALHGGPIGLVLIPEGASLSGVLTCERLIVHGRFVGTIYGSPSRFQNARDVEGQAPSPSDQSVRSAAGAAIPSRR